jgi:hypothetical protein
MNNMNMPPLSCRLLIVPAGMSVAAAAISQREAVKV